MHAPCGHEGKELSHPRRRLFILAVGDQHLGKIQRHHQQFAPEIAYPKFVPQLPENLRRVVLLSDVTNDLCFKPMESKLCVLILKLLVKSPRLLKDLQRSLGLSRLQ